METRIEVFTKEVFPDALVRNNILGENYDM